MNRDPKWALAEMGYADMLLECGRLSRQHAQDRAEIEALQAEFDRLQERIRTLEGKG